MIRLFLKCHSQKKRFPPFARLWEIQTRALYFRKRERRSNSEKKAYWPSLGLLGKLSGQILVPSILGSLYLPDAIEWPGPGRVWCFLDIYNVNPKSLFLKLGNPRVG